MIQQLNHLKLNTLLQPLILKESEYIYGTLAAKKYTRYYSPTEKGLNQLLALKNLQDIPLIANDNELAQFIAQSNTQSIGLFYQQKYIEGAITAACSTVSCLSAVVYDPALSKIYLHHADLFSIPKLKQQFPELTILCNLKGVSFKEGNIGCAIHDLENLVQERNRTGKIKVLEIKHPVHDYSIFAKYSVGYFRAQETQGLDYSAYQNKLLAELIASNTAKIEINSCMIS